MNSPQRALRAQSKIMGLEGGTGYRGGSGERGEKNRIGICNL